MNIPLQAFLLLLLLLPGVIFNAMLHFRLHGLGRRVDREVSIGSVDKVVASDVQPDDGPFNPLSRAGLIVLVVSAVIHLVAIMLVTQIGFQIDFSTLVSLLLGNMGTGIEFAQRLEIVSGSLGRQASYLLLTLGLGAALGSLARALVRKSGLDRRFHLLSYRSFWVRNLEVSIDELRQAATRVRSLERLGLDSEVAGQLHVDRVLTLACNVGEATYLYRGVLKAIELDREGVPRFRLHQVHRRKISDDPTPESKERFYTIPGEGLIVDAREVLNVNLEILVSVVHSEVEPTQASASVTDSGVQVDRDRLR